MIGFKKNIMIMVMVSIAIAGVLTVKVDAASKNSGKCGENLFWTYDNSTATLTINGKGAMYDYLVDSGADSGEASGKEPEWYQKKIKRIVIENGVTRIGSCAFSALRELTTIEFPKSIKSIGELAFECDISLEKIEFPDNVTTIASNAIAGCCGLKELIIGKGYTQWELQLPEENNVLDTILISEENPKYKSEKGMVFSKDGTELICSERSIEKIIIPEGVETIREGAFQFCTKLKSILIPESVKTIKERAFCYCEALESINIPDSVISIEGGAFMNCTALINLEVGSGLKNWVPYDSLKECNRLESITISNENKYFASMPGIITSKVNNSILFCLKTVTNLALPQGMEIISQDMFQNLSILESIVIPDSVTLIGAGAFRNCKNLKTITIPDSVTNIEHDAFYNCVGLEKVTLSENLEQIADCTFWGCSSLTEIEIPDKVNEIGFMAFGDCNGLRKITLHEGIKSIGIRAFQNCAALEAIDIPPTVTKIDNGAFSGCGLECIDIPDSVDNLGEEAFRDCKQLRSAVLSEQIAAIKAYTFLNCSTLSVVEIKKGTTYIGCGAFENCSRLKEITIPVTVTKLNNSFSRDVLLVFAGGISNSLVNVYTIEGKKNGIRMEWNPVKDASGYQIMYSNKKNFKNAVTVEVYKAMFQKTFPQKGSHKYYIKTRAYQIINGKKVYGVWSEIKTF